MTKIKKKKSAKIIMIILILAVAAGGAWYYWDSTNISSLVPDRESNPNGWLVDETRINILLIGADTFEEGHDTGRSDSLIVTGIDLESGEISMLSIPRDTYVKIEGHGHNKINAAYSYGGIPLVRSTIEDLLGIPIDYYAKTDFAGFREIVDLLGGIDIDVDKRMYYHTYDGLIDIKPGMQHLDGEKALQYVRFRHEAMGDISRTERQQKFLVAVYEAATSPENISRLPEVMSSLLKELETDLTNSQLTRLSSIARRFETENIRHSTLPGWFWNYNGGSYWKNNEEETTELVKIYFSDYEPEPEAIKEGAEGSEENA